MQRGSLHPTNHELLFLCGLHSAILLKLPNALRCCTRFTAIEISPLTFSFPHLYPGEEVDDPRTCNNHFDIMGNQSSRAVGEGEAYNGLLPSLGGRPQPYGIHPESTARLKLRISGKRSLSSMESAYVRGEAQAGRTDNGSSAFAKATHGKEWSGVASTSKTGRRLSSHSVDIGCCCGICKQCCFGSHR